MIVLKRGAAIKLLTLSITICIVLSLGGCFKKEAPSSIAPSEPSSSEPVVEGALEAPKLKPKIDEAVTKNKDTVGWIYIPDTTIDNMVVQSKDNTFYLRLNEDKKYDVFGCYFMDYESKQGSRAEMSQNNIIYGHSDLRDNKDGPRFSQLFKFTDIEFLKNHPYIFYSTKSEEMVWQIFSVFYTRIDFNYIDANPNPTNFAKIVEEAKLRSEFVLDVPVAGSDKILALSTCTVKYVPGDTTNYRLVIMAKLLPDGKQLPPTVEVKDNPSPKRS